LLARPVGSGSGHHCKLWQRAVAEIVKITVGATVPVPEGDQDGRIRDSMSRGASSNEGKSVKVTERECDLLRLLHSAPRACPLVLEGDGIDGRRASIGAAVIATSAGLNYFGVGASSPLLRLVQPVGSCINLVSSRAPPGQPSGVATLAASNSLPFVSFVSPIRVVLVRSSTILVTPRRSSLYWLMATSSGNLFEALGH
jgi:hypothetical protein